MLRRSGWLTVLLCTLMCVGQEAVTAQQTPTRGTDLKGSEKIEAVAGEAVTLRAEVSYAIPPQLRWQKTGGNWCQSPLCDWRSFGYVSPPGANTNHNQVVYWVSEDPGTFTVSIIDRVGNRDHVVITVTTELQ